MSLKIAIIGAGPGGTALARILSQTSCRQPLDITIFEGEASRNIRGQGGTLDLRKGSGLDAIKAANLYDEFLRYARFEGGFAEGVCDKNMVQYFSVSGDAEDKNGRAPEIDRAHLREILIDSLPADTISWGKCLDRADEEPSDGTYTLYFRDGTQVAGFHLVVGADGAWSKVRPLVTDVKPRFTGITGQYYTVSEPKTMAPDAYKFANQGSVFSIYDCRWMGLQQLGDGSLMSSTYYRAPGGDETWIDKLPTDIRKDTKAARKYCLDAYSEWHPTLKQVVENADSEVQTRNLYMLPVGTRWTHRRGVTLIGDAAHLTSPFAGEGVNQALTDAKVLAHAINEALKSSSLSRQGDKAEEKTARLVGLDGAVERYEQEMFKRMPPIMRKTEKMMSVALLTPGPISIEEFVLAAAGSDLPLKSLTLPLLTIFVYTYFFFVKLYRRPSP